MKTPTDAPTTLDVAWTMSVPPLPAKQWRQLTPGPESKLPSDEALEKGLAWPQGTIAFLRTAFDKNLSRSDGWQIASPTQRAAGLAAAKVYKRGVANSQEPPHVQSGSYLITFEPLIRPQTALLKPFQHSFFIADAKLAAAWPQVGETATLAVTLSERTKTLESVADILEAWRTAGSPIEWLVAGGGVLADTAAFAASLVGAKLTLMPTTLLAMVDACVGGKTGVNFAPYGKNQVGAFYFPTAVVVWPGWLKTLPLRELRAGISEAIKHALLSSDRTLRERVLAQPGDWQYLAELLPKLVTVKANIVAADPAENGQRAVLNLGHTLAHALEAQSHASGHEVILHGEAVGLGLAFALLLSEKFAGLPKIETQKGWTALQQAGCLMSHGALAQYLGSPALASEAVWQRLFRFILHDKKRQSGDGVTDWVLLRRLGEPWCEGESFTLKIAAPALRDAWLEFLTRL